MAESEIAITCPCGGTEMKLGGPPIVCVYCHCDDCQVAHGAAYIGAAIFPAARVVVVRGEILRWSRRTTARATCGRCGSRLFAEPSGLGVRSVTSTLLPAGLFQPALHMQCQHAVAPIRDELPKYRGYPAAMGGSDDLMTW